jgi:hypothetical protein
MPTSFPTALVTIAALALLSAGSALAAPKAAVFPFDFRDAQQAGEVVPQYNPEDLRRVKLVADELKRLMAADGKYEVVDLSSRDMEVQAASPFDQCNGCEVPIAKEAGADLAVTGFVDKVSIALINLAIIARNTKTGALEKTMSASINGDTDELWLHGVRYLWKNRFNVEATAK